MNSLKRVISLCLLLFLTGCVDVSVSSHISKGDHRWQLLGSFVKPPDKVV